MPFARQAAIATSVLLAAVTALHLYWVLGGSWALHAVSGGQASTPSTGARAFFAAIAMLAIVAAVEALVLGRVVQGPVLRRTVWTAVAVLALGGVIRMAAAPIVGVAAVLLALLFALLVFDAPRPATVEHSRRH